MMLALEAVETRVRYRRESWQTEETLILPPPEYMNELCIVTKYSRLGMETHRRYLLQRVLISVNGCNETPSAIARDYIAIKYGRGPKWREEQRDKVRKVIAEQPLYVRPCKFEDGYYIDIRAAYWSIMLLCGWNVDYYPGVHLGRTDPPIDFPWAYNKTARNCLVSVGRSTEMPMWSPRKGHHKKRVGNPRANTQLFCLITDILHGIANEAISAGACYVFGDGIIAPNEAIARKVLDIIMDWGLEPYIKGEGAGFVSGLGSYIVGRYRTKHLLDQSASYCSIKRLDYHKWLRRNMAMSRVKAHWFYDFINGGGLAQ